MMRCVIALLLVVAASMPAVSLTRQERRLEAAGYIDVKKAVPSAEVQLMYARADNFTGRVLYDSLHHAYLHPDAAKALAAAQRKLSQLKPGCRLLVKDAARPVSVQRHMFSVVRGTTKSRYVANPANSGGTHNFGVAVDVTLCDSLGRELPMGTPVDHLGPEANIDREDALVARGTITRAELANRRLLRRVMTQSGFKTIRKEWWHFELVRRAVAAKRYRLIDF